jgi:hypothetical protein
VTRWMRVVSIASARVIAGRRVAKWRASPRRGYSHQPGHPWSWRVSRKPISVRRVYSVLMLVVIVPTTLKGSASLDM